MPAKIFSASLFGFDCKLVEVEVDILNGMSSITIVGLGDTAVQESKERIRSAIKNSELDYPRRKKTINLAPADIPKHGPMFDLPIALGLLLKSEQIPESALDDTLVLGELALSGDLRKTVGVLPVTAFAKRFGFKHIIIPEANADEASLVSGISIIAAKNLAQVVSHLRGEKIIAPLRKKLFIPEKGGGDAWHFEDVQNHHYAKRALLIAAAGGHNILLYGPPGSGKTILARSFQNILPPLCFEDAVEVTKIYSIAGKLSENASFITNPPFRAVHHTASMISLSGGGMIPKPGEISLAHKGVLFLDELLEFPRSNLDVLRQPLEDGTVYVSRAKGSVKFPADFQLIAATNPCPCGYFGDPFKHCLCSENHRMQYHKKLSGPLLDRIDLVCHVPRLPFEKITNERQEKNESSETMRAQVAHAREIQHKRSVLNGKLSAEQVRQYCNVNPPAVLLLKEAFQKFHYSGRAYYRILKVARTIADLENVHEIEEKHIAEALQYRPRISDKGEFMA